MENEIELKLMLNRENIPLLTHWFNRHPHIHSHYQQTLGNTYFDTPKGYFAEQKMGLRVRQQNQHYEITLKTAGDIVGGLHIRPEYNLPLENPHPDFCRLVRHFDLPIENAEAIQAQLTPTFSTDFERTLWLIEHQNARIEIALDQGHIKNPHGQEAICEIEFELKKGDITALFDLLSQMPKADGMWLSSLSKAQRGYLVGNPQKQAVEIEPFFAQATQPLTPLARYQLEQNLADFIRIGQGETLIPLYLALNPEQKSDNLLNYLTSQAYLDKNIDFLSRIFHA
ncbi:adenylate cyclase [Pasteurellaceae bacterium Macca]|nr:adenylate cyclase [Pasteurellaceae bacterium Macca]